MRVLLKSNHRYPAGGRVSSGCQPKALPSGSGQRMNDLLAKGLSELGHDVFYLLEGGADQPFPRGVRVVSEPLQDVDIWHNLESPMKPWVQTCHLDPEARGGKRVPVKDNWIFVSRTMAQSFGRDRYVLNGIDPSEYIY